jgi:hypothetical protein
MPEIAFDTGLIRSSIDIFSEMDKGNGELINI